MKDQPNPYEALIARLAADPHLALLARPEVAVLVWDRTAERLLWASPAGAGLGAADEAGRVVPGFRAQQRLKALASGEAPRQGARLERLRLDPARPWLPMACLCRLAALENGERVLVTAIAGPVPSLPARPRSVQVPMDSSPQHEAPANASETVREPDHRSRTVRFVWQADAQARFTQVSSSLADAVGTKAADILGRSWDEIAGMVVDDPDEVISGLFARRETWSARTVLWRTKDPAKQVPVDLAGMPVFGEGRELTGFRGFGLLRMDTLREREAPEEESDETSNAPSEENWFTHLRDRVAEAMSGLKPVAQEPTLTNREPSEQPEDRAPSLEKARPAPLSASLSSTERNAFREIARALGARLEGDAPSSEQAILRHDFQEETPPEPDLPAQEDPAEPGKPLVTPNGGDQLLDRLPIGILVHRDGQVLFANRFLLGLTGYETAEQVEEQGGLDHILPDHADTAEDRVSKLTVRNGEPVAVSLRTSDAEWNGEAASLILIREASAAVQAQCLFERRIEELEAILDTATDGVIVFDETGRILSINRAAEALFGYDQREVAGDAITVLLAPESHIVALHYLDGLRSPGVASVLNDGREVLGRVRQGGTIPLFMTMGHLSDGPERKFCAVLRDITAFKKAEGELLGAKRAAEEASAQKSDLLAKISHEIRTPLNAILGFAEVMLEESFGPLGTERYKEYLKDIHASGAHVISLVNDLLDLAKVEAGRLELSFTSVNLNDLVASCVTLLQPQAARERIVMRTSFASKVPPVVADERSMRQIVLNLVSNAIKFTDPGGQVIVSTAMTDNGEVAFRVRDTGIGMTEVEIEAALEPFRQLATARRRGGTGLGLPLTKALVEANRGALQIASQPSEGTLVEVIFPPTRVLAE